MFEVEEICKDFFSLDLVMTEEVIPVQLGDNVVLDCVKLSITVLVVFELRLFFIHGRCKKVHGISLALLIISTFFIHERRRQIHLFLIPRNGQRPA